MELPSEGDTLRVLMDQVLSNMHLMLPDCWIPVVKGGGIHLGYMADPHSFKIQRCLYVRSCGKVSIEVHGKPLPGEHELWPLMRRVPLNQRTVGIFSDNVLKMVHLLRSFVICCGVENYEHLWLKAPNSEIDKNLFSESRYKTTCRVNNCFMLVTGFHIKRCKPCNKLQSVLRERSRSKAQQASTPTTPKANKPHAYLTTPETKKRVQFLSKKVTSLTKKNRRLESILDKHGVQVDDKELSDDFADILKRPGALSNLTPLQKTFIRQQIEASQVEKACNIKWHPAIIRFALSLQMNSNAAYEEVSGILRMPSRRTLYNYSHAISTSGEASTESESSSVLSPHLRCDVGIGSVPHPGEDPGGGHGAMPVLSYHRNTDHYTTEEY